MFEIMSLILMGALTGLVVAGVVVLIILMIRDLWRNLQQ